MTTKESVRGFKSQSFPRGKFESGRNQMLSCEIFKKMSACENIFNTCRKHRITHPVILHFTQALVPDRTSAQVTPIIFTRWCGALDQLIDKPVDRLVRQMI